MKVKLNEFIWKNDYKISIKETKHSLIYVQIICNFIFMLEEKVPDNLDEQSNIKKDDILDEVIREAFCEEIKPKLKEKFDEILKLKLISIFTDSIVEKFLKKLTMLEYSNLFIREVEDKYKYFCDIIKRENLTFEKIEKNKIILEEIRNYIEDESHHIKNIKLLRNLTLGDLFFALENNEDIEKIIKIVKNKREFLKEIEKELLEINISIEYFFQLFFFYKVKRNECILKLYEKYIINVKKEIVEILKNDIYIDENMRIPLKGECLFFEEKYSYEISLDNYKVILKKYNIVSKNKKENNTMELFYKKRDKYFIRGDVINNDLENKQYYLNSETYNKEMKVFPLINGYRKQKLLVDNENEKYKIIDNFYNLGNIFVIGNKNYIKLLDRYGTEIRIKYASPKSVTLVPSDIEGLSILKIGLSILNKNSEKKDEIKDKRFILFYNKAIIPLPYYKNVGNKKFKKRVYFLNINIQKVDSLFLKIESVIKVQSFKYKTQKIKRAKNEILIKSEMYFLEDYQNLGKKIILKMSKFNRREFYKKEEG